MRGPVCTSKDNADSGFLTREATYGQFNIVICTDQEHDDFQDLQGQILPMDLLNLEVAPRKNVNIQIYVFDTGKYLRHGKWERNFWWWYGNSKKPFFDPFAMHVHFEQAQKKLNANQVKAEQEKKAQEDKVAADAKAAEKAAQNSADAKKKFVAQQAQQAQAVDQATAQRVGQQQQAGAQYGQPNPYHAQAQQYPAAGYAVGGFPGT